MTDPVANWQGRLARRLKLRDLHILSAVVQAGSMTKGAAHLGISQPSVWEAIASLEDTLRIRLLDRSRRGVEPTIYARALLKRGAVVFDELTQGVRDIEFLADPAAGEVRVGCPESMMTGFVPAIIDRMSRQSPRIVVRVAQADTATLAFPELRNREIDLMLGKLTGPVNDNELDAEVLFHEKYFVVAGMRSQWARRRKVTLAELVDEPWIHMPTHNPFGALIMEAFRARGLPAPRESVSTFSMQLRIDLLATGRFLTLMPGSLLAFNAKRWSLKALPVDLGIRRQGAVITLSKRTLSPVVALFIEHARAVARSLAK